MLKSYLGQLRAQIYFFYGQDEFHMFMAKMERISGSGVCVGEGDSGNVIMT